MLLKAILSVPLMINVSEIASYLPEFRYRGPFTTYYPSYQEVTSEFIINDADAKKSAVLFFNDKIREGFTSIASDYPTPELATMVNGLPRKLAYSITTSLKKTALSLPSLSDDELANVQSAFENEKAKYAAWKKLQQPLRNVKQVDFNKAQTIRVLPHEYALTTATSEKPILGAFGEGIGPDFILALYDENKKTAVLAHINILTKISSLNGIISSSSPQHTVAHFVGGDLSSKTMWDDVVAMLLKNSIKTINSDINTNDIGNLNRPISFSLAIDARTGAIYSPIMPNQLEKRSDWGFHLLEDYIEFTSSPIRRYYGGAPAFVETEASKEDALSESLKPDGLFNWDKYRDRLMVDSLPFGFDIEANPPASTSPFASFGWNPSFFSPNFNQASKGIKRVAEESDDECLDRLLETTAIFD